MSDSDDDMPQLSAETLTALQEFYSEQEMKQKQIVAMQSGEIVEGIGIIDEDWQLSQFWYDEETATSLAHEALRVAGNSGRIACLSSPTLYQKLRELKPATCTAVLFEYDRRFEIYSTDFVFYDYKSPLEFPDSIEFQSFDIVIADPPFLSEECLKKTAETVKFLTKDKVILCTGAVMEEVASEVLGVHLCEFKPKHTRNLANEFRCFANYQTGLENTT
ncbi:EEF1A lysine methyltransferase 1-like [Ptychodera flava]|uniref:EEF1A lysine methyltransferase 1-like n=1 Tax=Ptychodera flava TaxID=63121 RepID=UPI00396AA52E